MQNRVHTHHCSSCNLDFICDLVTHCQIEDKTNAKVFIKQICPNCNK